MTQAAGKQGDLPKKLGVHLHEAVAQDPSCHYVRNEQQNLPGQLLRQQPDHPEH